MQSESFNRAAADIFISAFQILLHKRIERGTANIEKQGLTGIIQRMQGDKLERVRIWARHRALREELRGIMPQDVIDSYIPEDTAHDVGKVGDSITDDLLDTMNYSCIALMLLRSEWTLPVQKLGTLVVADVAPYEHHIDMLFSINGMGDLQPANSVPTLDQVVHDDYERSFDRSDDAGFTDDIAYDAARERNR